MSQATNRSHETRRISRPALSFLNTTPATLPAMELIVVAAAAILATIVAAHVWYARWCDRNGVPRTAGSGSGDSGWSDSSGSDGDGGD
jgi:hypothetical protein